VQLGNSHIAYQQYTINIYFISYNEAWQLFYSYSDTACNHSLYSSTMPCPIYGTTAPTILEGLPQAIEVENEYDIEKKQSTDW